MANPRVELNRAGVSAILKSDGVRAMTNAAARRLAAAITGVDEDDIDIGEYTTDRGASSVSVPAEAQARDGALTRAAARIGLEVRS